MGEMQRESKFALIAPDSFKGTFSALDVATAIEIGVKGAGFQADVCPVADGGEGTLDVLRRQLGGDLVEVEAHDPTGGRITAEYLVLPDGTAVIETARTSGFGMRPINAWTAEHGSTFGTGEMIAGAIRAGHETILVSTGGSATTDGGLGAVAAINEMGGARGADITVLCDVDTHFDRAALEFGPQKGADPDLVMRLTKKLHDLALTYPRDPRAIKSTGCAGGLSGALWSHFDAKLVSGGEFILEKLSFGRRLSRASLVISGEGCLDDSTLSGKIVAVVAKAARARNTPCYVVTGRRKLESRAARNIGISQVIVASSLDEISMAGRIACASAV
jgi:glycerate kinase